jgi:hypothetical protein
MKNNKFEFYPTKKYFEPIVEAKHFIPNWYKKIPPYINGKLEISNYETNLTIKNCMPFLDSLSSGFMVTTQMDIQVKLVNGEPVLTWLQIPDPIILRSDKVQGFPNPANTHDLHFAWILPCSFKTPKGYSVFFTHPFNRFDLPFTTLNAIIDGEKGIVSGFIPFFLNKDFEGIIPKGTPIAQIVPFKKENWIAEKNEKVHDLANQESFNARSIVRGYYKANVWIKTLFQVKNGEEPTYSQHQH